MGENVETAWQISGEDVANCNCNWACPCQFDAGRTETVMR